MKSKITLLLAVVVFASCSTPKYSYYFNDAGRYAAKSKAADKAVSPLAIDADKLTASTSAEPVSVESSEVSSSVVSKTYLQMNKSERKALRQYLKSEIKSHMSVKKHQISESNHHAAAGMDNDLKLAAIFGAVGLVGLIIGGNVFNIIGGIALLIGVVFFVKWLIRQ